MTAISVMQFYGEAAGVTPRLIPQGYAQQASNCDVSMMTLRGIKSPEATEHDTGIIDPKAIYKYPNGLWLAWDNDVDVVRSPLADDAYERIYWTGDGAPKLAAIDTATAGSAPYPNVSYTLGVPAPDNEITISSEPSGTEPDTAVKTVYSHSYISTYGEEGPLSAASAIATRWDDGGDVTINIPSITATGMVISKVRIYRSEDGGEYNHVVDLAAGTGSFVDSVNTDELGGTSVSIEWDPPNENMRGLTVIPGGFMAGFFDNVLCFSEPGYPHAWPISYRLRFDDDIVGIAVSASGIVVCTRGMPYLVVGSVPSSMDMVKVETPQSCLSKRSIVDMGDYALYASPDGLVQIGNGAGLVSGNLMTRDRWKSLNPSSIHAYRESDRYLAFYTDTGGNSGAFSFSAARGFEFFDLSCSTAFYEPYEDVLYMASDTGLLAFDAGERTSYTWRSGIFEVQPGTSFTCGKIVAANYPVSLTVNVGLTELYTITAESDRMFRLPAGRIDRREFDFTLSSEFEVYSVQLAQSPSELI